MRRAVTWVLCVVGVIGLLSFLSFEWRKDINGQTFKMGEPDIWLLWEEKPEHLHSEMRIDRWSMGIGIASVFALYYSARLRRRSAIQQEKAAS